MENTDGNRSFQCLEKTGSKVPWFGNSNQEITLVLSPHRLTVSSETSTLPLSKTKFRLFIADMEKHMELDNAYLEKLLQPLKGKVGITSVEYFGILQTQGIKIETPQGVADKQFESHLKHLISSGAITNDKNTSKLNDFGIGFGPNGHIILWDSALIKLGINNSPAQPVINNTINIGGSVSGNLQVGHTNTVSNSKRSSVSQWFLDNLGKTIVSIVTALLLAWLGLRPQ